MAKRAFTWAASLIVALAIFGMAAQAAMIDPFGQALASAHSSMPPGCKSCDAPSVASGHCGLSCLSAVAMPEATVAGHDHIRLAYSAPLLAELIGLNAQPDSSPPK